MSPLFHPASCSLDSPDKALIAKSTHSISSGGKHRAIGTSKDRPGPPSDEESLDTEKLEVEKVEYQALSSHNVFGYLREVSNTVCTRPPLPPPMPPLFHHRSSPNSTNFRGTELQSNGERCDKQESEVKKKAKENGYSKQEKNQDESQGLIIPSREIQSFSKGILFLLGEDYEFEQDKLIQLWMAAGFIANEPMEINGATYFEKLVSEKYILLSDSNSLYRVNSEKVKSDLSRIPDKSSYLRLESTSHNNVEPAQVLHVSVVCEDIDDEVFKKLDKFNRLRTLLFVGTYESKLREVPVDLFLSFESLFVLDLSGTNIHDLPSSVGKMIHLRYLDLSWTFIERLPEAISRFKWLQTLKLKGCSHLRRLPREMKRLAQLRHLDFNILSQLASMPEGIGALKNLRTLSAFLVGTQEGCKISELRDLNNLTGELCVARLENVQSENDAEVASLSAKNHLKMLDLRWSDFPLRELSTEGDDDYSVLKNLRPHSSLEELQIRCYGSTNLPSWIADESFDKLSSITLFKCEHVLVLPSMQKLPSLEYLELISLNSVRTMDFGGEMDHVAFPKLQKLIIEEMLNLEIWVKAKEGDFPCLVELMMKDCPKLPELPSLPYLSSLKRLELSSCPQAQFLPDKKLSNSLEFLIAENCPLIKESCSKQGGECWDVIKHVRDVWIDQEAVLESTDDDSEILDEADLMYGGETDDDDEGEYLIATETDDESN